MNEGGFERHESITDEQAVEAMRAGDTEKVRQWADENMALLDSQYGPDADRSAPVAEWNMRYAKAMYSAGMKDDAIEHLRETSESLMPEEASAKLLDLLARFRADVPPESLDA